MRLLLVPRSHAWRSWIRQLVGPAALAVLGAGLLSLWLGHGAMTTQGVLVVGLGGAAGLAGGVGLRRQLRRRALSGETDSRIWVVSGRLRGTDAVRLSGADSSAARRQAFMHLYLGKDGTISTILDMGASGGTRDLVVESAEISATGSDRVVEVWAWVDDRQVALRRPWWCGASRATLAGVRRPPLAM